MSKTFRIGTRASKMAVRQTQAVIEALQRKFPSHHFEMVTRPADADLDLKSRLSSFGGKGGAFIAAMRAMMLEGTADMAMHSLKDLPGNDEYYADDRFALGACLPRSDARDALVLRNPPAGATPDRPVQVIGTSSVRRTAFLRRLFPKAKVVPFRGAADKRIERLDGGISMEFNYGARTPALDALVLARNGLERIDLGHRVSSTFPVEEMCPAVGQGVVVVEFARANAEVAELLGAVNHRPTMYCYQAERALLRTLNGHCDSPIGGYAEIVEGRLTLRAVVISLDGRSLLEVRDESEYAEPARLGVRVARRLNELGAQSIIDESRFSD